MLIPVSRLVNEFDVHPTGVLHLGAHLAEELPDYEKARWGEVWWVEANPSIFEKLVRRCQAQPMIARMNHPIHALVGEREGETATLRIASNGQSSSVLPFGTHATEHPEVTMTGEEIELPVMTVDLLALGLEITADFINLDLQGYELAALRGAVRFLGGVKWVYCEVNREELYQGCALVGDIDVYLIAHGFERRATKWTRHGWGDALYVRTS